MSTHLFYMDDCTVVVPEGFRDRSTNVLEWRTPEGDSIALVIQREPVPATATGAPREEPFDLPRWVAEQTRGYPAQFAGFSLERDETAAPDSGFPMRRKAFRWHKDREVLYHHQAFVHAGERVVVITGAAKARHRDAVDALMNDALDNFRVRGD